MIPIIRKLGHIRLTIFLLFKLFFLILFATFAQVDRGIFLANKLYFTSWFVWGNGFPIFFGGYTIGALLVINLLCSHSTKFKKSRAYIGIFFIHFGLVLLIIGAGLTSFFGQEMQIAIKEGESKNYLDFPSQFNVVIIDASESSHDMLYEYEIDDLKQGINFKGSKIKLMHLSPNAIINQRGIDNLSYNQLGQTYKLISMPKTYKMTERNVPGIKLSISNEKGSNLYMLWGGSSIYQSAEISNKSYLIKLRPKREYLDFSLNLLDFQRHTYQQSNTVERFKSMIEVVTNEGRIPFTIQMNDPLRYSGYTFFQSSFTEDETTSVFQVVKNPSWIMPYLSSVIIISGLFIQMLGSMRKKHD
jgi:hypothetical protein